jgi:hypothetical protein
MMSDQTNKPGFVGWDKDGRFIHYCHCGEWAPYGYNVSVRHGRLGQWYCREHRPPDPQPQEQPQAQSGGEKTPLPPLTPTQGKLL